MSGVRAIVLLDAQGVAVASNQAELIGMSLADAQRFRAIRSRPDPEMLYISQPFATPLSKARTLSLGRAVIDAQGRFAGCVLAIFDPESFDVLMQITGYAPGVSVSLIHEDGAVFVTHQSPGAQSGADLGAAAGAFMGEHISSGRLHSFYSGPLSASVGDAMVAMHSTSAATSPVDKALVVVVSRADSETYAAWLDHAAEKVALFALLSLAGAVWAVAHQRRRQLDALLQHEQERALAEVEAQADMRETKSRWEVALDGSLLGVWDWHLDTGMALLSARYMAILGEEARDQVVPDAFALERMHPDDVTRVREAHQRHFAHLTPRYTADYRVRHKSGEYVWVRSSGLVAERGPDDTALRMVGTLVDMTSERLLQNRVIELNVSLES